MGWEDDTVDKEQLVYQINAGVEVGENMLTLYRQMKGDRKSVV